MHIKTFLLKDFLNGLYTPVIISKTPYAVDILIERKFNPFFLSSNVCVGEYEKKKAKGEHLMRVVSASNFLIFLFGYYTNNTVASIHEAG